MTIFRIHSNRTRSSARSFQPGVFFLDMSQAKEAASKYKTALQIDPNDIETLIPFGLKLRYTSQDLLFMITDLRRALPKILKSRC